MFTTATTSFKRVVATMTKGKNLSSHAMQIEKGIFHEKTIKEAWFLDKSTYPVLAIIPIGLSGAAVAGLHYLLTSPDVRLVPRRSRSKMFRGELADEYLKEEVDVSK